LRATPGPFLIAVAHADGTESGIPASSFEELGAMLGRLTIACEKARRPTPPTAVWRLDRGEARPLSRAELEEGHLQDLPILVG
jgi:Ser/Thr protein kinase RdoA (MazF antagonist)